MSLITITSPNSFRLHARCPDAKVKLLSKDTDVEVVLFEQNGQYFAIADSRKRVRTLLTIEVEHEGKSSTITWRASCLPGQRPPRAFLNEAKRRERSEESERRRAEREAGRKSSDEREADAREAEREAERQRESDERRARSEARLQELNRALNERPPPKESSDAIPPDAQAGSPPEAS